VTVSVLGFPGALGTTDDGLNAQVTPVGSGVTQLSATELENPLSAKADSAYIVWSVWPEGTMPTLRLVGVEVKWKSFTVSVALSERVWPWLVALIVNG